MLLVDRIIQPRPARWPFEGCCATWLYPTDGWFFERDWPRADLIIPFVVGEEEEFVFFDRPSDGSAVLPPDEERIIETFSEEGLSHNGLRTDGSQGRLRPGNAAILWSREEEEPAAMQVIRPRARDNVHDSGGDGSRREIEAQGADLELLDGLGGEIFAMCRR